MPMGLINQIESLTGLPSGATPVEHARAIAGRLGRLNLDAHLSPGEIRHCIVVDAISHLNCYLVTAPQTAMTPAFLLTSESSLLPVGNKTHSMLMPGTPVLVWFPPNRDWAVILGASGHVTPTRNIPLPGSVVPGSRSGLFSDLAHSLLPFASKKRPAVFNASAGRPVDALPGDWGQSTELGLMIHLGRAMALLRASDVAGISFNWLDDLARLWGYNLEVFTAGSERYAYDDEGEFTDREGLTPYPWEALGAISPGDEVSAFQQRGIVAGRQQGEEEGDEDVDQEALSLEPVTRDQAPVWRRQSFRGFLGGLVRHITQAPFPADGDPETLARTARDLANSSGTGAPYMGLLDIQEGLDGRYSVRSAKEITFEKTILIPAPKQVKTPADPTGDAGSNFNAAARNWDGLDEDAQVDALEEFEFADDWSKAAQLYDYHSYMFNVYGVQGFRVHPRDWSFPDEEDLRPTDEEFTGGLHDGVEPTDDYRMPLPQYGSMVIDHRTSTRYYRGRSVIKQLDDGSVLIEDAWGSQIRMEGGHVFITAPLDIVQQPGRSLVSMAGNDVVARAGNSVDITAAKRDVRLKAERNLQALAGNSGAGALLLESRGSVGPADYSQPGEDVEAGGIVIKSRFAPLYLVSNSIGLRAFQELMLIAGKLRMTGEAAFADDVVMNGQLDVDKVVAREGDLDILNAKTLDGTFTTDLGGSPSHAHTVSWTAQVSPPDTEDNEPANGTVASETDKAGFSLRTPEQYLLDEGTFVWWEHRWQQIYRHKGVGQVWDEPDVQAPGGQQTQPYPGKALWESDQFRTMDSDLFDADEGHAEKYEDIKDLKSGPDPESTSLKDGYLISRQGQ